MLPRAGGAAVAERVKVSEAERVTLGWLSNGPSVAHQKVKEALAAGTIAVVEARLTATSETGKGERTDPSVVVEPVAPEVQLSPAVESVLEAAGCPTAATGPADADSMLVAQNTDRSEAYCLGPVLLTGEALEGVSLAEGARERQVHLKFKAGTAGIDLFNASAKKCFDAEPICPSMRLALIHNGTVVAAPQILAANFERDGVVISGADVSTLESLVDDFSTVEFRPVAAALP